MKKLIIISLIVIVAVFSACENQKWSYPNFDYTTVYFPYQSPVRTIVLGQDYLYDNSEDNQHQCTIMATMGGVYSNTKDITLDVAVDNSLCNNLKQDSAGGEVIKAMPSNYYSLPANMQIEIPPGKLMGGIQVQLTDAFFADTNSINVTYVVPLVINSVTNADSVLRGEATSDTADRRVAGDWTIVPKDYVLYAIKYINPYQANYLRRGVEVATGNGGNTALDTTVVYHKQYVVDDQVCTTVTKSLNSVSLKLDAVNKGNLKTSFQAILTFDKSGRCTATNPASASYSITGNGEYVTEGDMWGGVKRDVIHLKYTVDFGTITHSFTDTLVLRDRGEKFETFVPVVAN